MLTLARLPQNKDDATLFKGTLILCMCLIYMVQFFLHIRFLSLLLYVITLLVFAACLWEANRVPRLLSIAMFVLGVALNFAKGSGMPGALAGLSVNLPLLTLILLVPLLSIPLKMEGYFASIHHFLTKWMTDARKIFASMSIFLFVLGPILNIGSIRVLQDMVKDIKLNRFLVSNSTFVGFSTVVLWSPYFASVALVLYYLHIPVVQYIPFGLSFAVIQLLMGNLLFWMWLKRSGRDTWHEPSELQSASELYHRKRVLHLFVFVCILMASIFIIEHVSKWPMMYIVSLIALVVPVLWCGVKNKWHASRGPLREYSRQTVSAMNNEIVLFISAGLFANALTGTAASDGIKSVLNGAAHISFLFFVITVLCSIVLLTAFGIHPIVVVTALVTQMDPQAIGTRPEALALLLMLSWSASVIISPINPVNMLVSGFANRSSWTVGVKWSGVYLLSMLTAGSLFIYMIH